MKWLNEPNLPEPRFCFDIGMCPVYLFCTGAHDDCSGFNCWVNLA